MDIGIIHPDQPVWCRTMSMLKGPRMTIRRTGKPDGSITEIWECNRCNVNGTDVLREAFPTDPESDPA